MTPLRRRVALVLFLLLTAVSATLATETRPGYLEQPAEIVLPVGYHRNTRYPVFVVLPPTGTRASWATTRLGLDPGRQGEFILVLPAGRPTREQYLPDFPEFVAWYEERLLADLAYVLANYSADPRRIYIGGYSLGGDLSWALVVRNPDLFAGAIIAGSRASHPVSHETLERLHERGFRGAFLIGDREDPVRYRGINYARTRFAAADVQHRYREYPGGHVMPATKFFQEQIRYVAEVSELPHPTAPIAITGVTDSVFFGHTSRDRFAIRAAIPAEVGNGGVVPASETQIALRVEWPWPHYYLRTTATHRTTTLSTDAREQRLHQDLLIGTGNARRMYGIGVGWDWFRRFPEEDTINTVDLLLMHGLRNPWIIPAGKADPYRIDSLFVVRYTIPRGIGSGPATEQLFNLRAEYLVRIADLFVIDAGIGSYTVQNRAVDSTSALSEALDHRIEWQLGVGLRAPSPVLWRIGHRGTRERALPDGDPDYRGVWTLTLEYSH